MIKELWDQIEKHHFLGSFMEKAKATGPKWILAHLTIATQGKKHTPGHARYAYQLQFVSHPYPSPVLQLDAQDGSTFLLIGVADTPSEPE